MKKIILILLCAAFTMVAHAQIYSVPLKAYKANFTSKSTPDTLVNTDTSYLVVTPAYLSPQYDVVLQWTHTKVSGTPAGTVIVQGSNDFSNWYTVATSKAEAPFLTDTVTVTNTASQTAAFVIPNHIFTYYRIRDISSGTQTGVLTGTIYYRKHSNSTY